MKNKSINITEYQELDGISVIVPLYNKEKSIVNTIQTVLNQNTKMNFEIVIVNDGSKDDSVNKICENINSNKITIINKINGGEADARNIGILNSKYNMVAFLDADDEWENDFFDKIIYLITKYPEAEVYCTNYSRNDGINSIKPNHNIWCTQDGIVDDYFLEVNNTLGDMLLTSSSVCINKSALSRSGLFSYGDKLGADQDLWFRLVISGAKIAFTNSVCANYIIDSENRVCNEYKRIDELNFVSRCKYKIKNKKINNKEAEKYLANCEMGIIIDMLDERMKIKPIIRFITQPYLLNGNKKRVLAIIKKCFLN